MPRGVPPAERSIPAMQDKKFCLHLPASAAFPVKTALPEKILKTNADQPAGTACRQKQLRQHTGTDPGAAMPACQTQVRHSLRYGFLCIAYRAHPEKPRASVTPQVSRPAGLFLCMPTKESHMLFPAVRQGKPLYRDTANQAAGASAVRSTGKRQLCNGSRGDPSRGYYTACSFADFFVSCRHSGLLSRISALFFRKILPFCRFSTPQVPFCFVFV